MPPVNDDFANATTLNPAGGTMQDDNTGATSDGAHDYLDITRGHGSHTVWYKIAPSASVRGLTIGTSAPISGTAIADSVIAIFKGVTLAGLTNIAYDDDSGPGAYSQLTTKVLPANETIYVEVTGYSDSNQGGYTLTWSFQSPTPPVGPANNHIINAISLITDGNPHTISVTTVGATEETNEHSYASGWAGVWYKINLYPYPTDMNVNVTIDMSGNAGFIPEAEIYSVAPPAPYTAVFEPYFPDFSLLDYFGWFGNGTVDPPSKINIAKAGPHSVPVGNKSQTGIFYIHVFDGNYAGYGTLNLTYTVTSYTPGPGWVEVPVGTEVKSPSADYTIFPGDIVAVKASAFMGGARGTLTSGSDATAPSSTYVSDTQVISTSYANMYAQANVDAAADTLTIDLDTIGINPDHRYNIYVCYKIIDSSPDYRSKAKQSFYYKETAGFGHKTDGYDSVFERWYGLFRGTNQWRYKCFESRLTQITTGQTNILHIRAFSEGDTATEIRIAQIVLMPWGPKSPVAGNWVDPDFWYYYQPDNYILSQTYIRPADLASFDVLSDGLGTATVDVSSQGVIYSNSQTNSLIEYQDGVNSSTAEPAILNIADGADYLGPRDHRLYHVWGTWGRAAEAIEDDTFTRTETAVTDPTVGYNSFGLSPYGYRYYTYFYPGPGQGAVWDNGGGSPTYMEVDGSSAVFAIGGAGSNCYQAKALLGTNLNASGGLHSTFGPLLDDLDNYIIEGVVSWDKGTPTSDRDLIACVGSGNLYITLNHKSNGELWGRIEVYPPYNQLQPWISSYVIVAPILFDSSYTPGDKIHLKIRRRGYVVDGKIWYDGDAEPSWTYSGYHPGQQSNGFSGRNDWWPYPYTGAQLNAQSYYQNGTFEWRPSRNGFLSYGGGTPFFENNATTGSETRTIYKWDRFKVDYDPDGDITKSGNLMLKDSITDTIVVGPVTAPAGRWIWTYCGKRIWETGGVSGVVYPNLSDYDGFNLYSWLDSGAGNLAGVVHGEFHSRAVKQYFVDLVGIIGNISMRWRKGRS